MNIATFIVNRANFNAGSVGGCDPNQRIIKRNQTTFIFLIYFSLTKPQCLFFVMNLLYVCLVEVKLLSYQISAPLH